MCIWAGCDCFCAAGRMKRCRKLPRQELRHRIQRINMQARPRFCRYNLIKQDSHRSKQPCSCAKERLSRIIEVTCNAARELAESQKTCSGQTSVPSRFRPISRGVTDAKESSGRVADVRKHGHVGGMWEDEQPVLVRSHPGSESNCDFPGRSECGCIDAASGESDNSRAGSRIAGASSLQEIPVCGKLGR